MEAIPQNVALACVPDAIPSGERAVHFVLAKRLLGKEALNREILPNGLAFRLPADALAAVAQFIANERKCCPFMKFEIDIAPGTDTMSLRMTGPAGTRELLEAELDLNVSCGCK